MCMNCVRVEGLQSAYGRKKILQGITFEAHAGECIGIVGRNGCGKSTLLNILAGIYKPAAGSLFLMKNPVHPKISVNLQLMFPKIAICTKNFPCGITCCSGIRTKGVCKTH